MGPREAAALVPSLCRLQLPGLNERCEKNRQSLTRWGVGKHASVHILSLMRAHTHTCKVPRGSRRRWKGPGEKTALVGSKQIRNLAADFTSCTIRRSKQSPKADCLTFVFCFFFLPSFLLPPLLDLVDTLTVSLTAVRRLRGNS